MDPVAELDPVAGGLEGRRIGAGGGSGADVFERIDLDREPAAGKYYRVGRDLQGIVAGRVEQICAIVSAGACFDMDCLKPLGAELLRELIQDPQNTFKCPTGFNLSYSYTDKITKGSPITEGVKGIWYNSELRAEFNTSAIEVSKDWQVLNPKGV